MLQPSEEHVRAVIDSAQHGILITDAWGVVMFHNESAARLFGYEPGELVGLEVNTLVPDDLGLTADELPADLQRNTVLAFAGITFDTRARKRDGEEFAIEATVTRVDVHQHTSFTVMLRDITSRLLAEVEKDHLHAELARAHKLESVGQLAAGVAHEINTPTQYVGDNLQFLRDSFADLLEAMRAFRAAAGAVDAERESALRAAEDAAARLDLEYLEGEIPRAIEQGLEGAGQIAGIVSAMKAFCHPGNTEKLPTDLNGAAKNTVSVSRNEWKYVAEVELDLAVDLPLVACNENEIKQVLLNIVVNAAHALADVPDRPAGEFGTIRIATRSDGAFVELEIADDGPGIPDDVMPNIFDPFFTTKGVGRGTGQGLAIARSIVVDHHGGEIVVRSRPGAGTTFVIRLPL